MNHDSKVPVWCVAHCHHLLGHLNIASVNAIIITHAFYTMTSQTFCCNKGLLNKKKQN